MQMASKKDFIGLLRNCPPVSDLSEAHGRALDYHAKRRLASRSPSAVRLADSGVDAAIALDPFFDQRLHPLAPCPLAFDQVGELLLIMPALARQRVRLDQNSAHAPSPREKTRAVPRSERPPARAARMIADS
jgi:hypothetical protein